MAQYANSLGGQSPSPLQSLPHTCPLSAFTISDSARSWIQPLPSFLLTEGDPEALPQVRATGRGLVAEQHRDWVPEPPTLSWAPILSSPPDTYSRSHSSPTGTGTRARLLFSSCCLAVGSNLGLQEWGRTSRDSRPGAERNCQRN